MKNSAIVLFLLICTTGFSQRGDVVIHKDNRIDALVAKEGALIPPAIKPQIDGFRVQLFFDSDKTLVNDARSRFIAKFPTVDTYVDFNAPNFFLKVGDFRTRMEAEKIKTEVEAEFPTSFIVQEKVYLPRLVKDLE